MHRDVVGSIDDIQIFDRINMIYWIFFAFPASGPEA